MKTQIYKVSIDVSKLPKSEDYEFTERSKEVQSIMRERCFEPLNPFISDSDRQKILRYVPGKSLNPSDAQIRAWEVEETLRRTRKTTGELFPNAGDLYAALNKPVNKISYYQTARCRVKYTTK